MFKCFLSVLKKLNWEKSILYIHILNHFSFLLQRQNISVTDIPESELSTEIADDDLSLFTESSLFEEREKRETPASFQLGVTKDCIQLPNGSQACFDGKYQNPMQWHEKKERLDGMIKKLRQKLEELKVSEC